MMWRTCGGRPAPAAAFLRVLRVGEMNMTSGMALAFPGAASPTVISKCEAIAKHSKRRPKIVRLVSLFRLHRLYGMAPRCAAIALTAARWVGCCTGCTAWPPGAPCRPRCPSPPPRAEPRAGMFIA